MQGTHTNKKLQEHIYATLKYFGLFKFPLYSEEIQRYLGATATSREIMLELRAMVKAGVVFIHNDLYMLFDDPGLAERRNSGTHKAEKMMNEAHRSASVISHFPFVKGICVSGSLSKGYADEKSDIDFFIITDEKRLWICRTLLHLFKKFTFLVNKQHSYCMNYFIDESRLRLEEQNLFTATEIVTLKPLYNLNVYQDLVEANKSWVNDLYPNIHWNGYQNFHQRKSFIKVMAEFCLNIAVPALTNNLLMQLTDRLWRFKWKRKNYPMEYYDLAMKTRWYVSKNHPKNYQRKVLENIQDETMPVSATTLPLNYSV